VSARLKSRAGILPAILVDYRHDWTHPSVRDIRAIHIPLVISIVPVPRARHPFFFSHASARIPIFPGRVPGELCLGRSFLWCFVFSGDPGKQARAKGSGTIELVKGTRRQGYRELPAGLAEGRGAVPCVRPKLRAGSPPCVQGRRT
jgi:hypothetical protein